MLYHYYSLSYLFICKPCCILNTTLIKIVLVLISSWRFINSSLCFTFSQSKLNKKQGFQYIHFTLDWTIFPRLCFGLIYLISRIRLSIELLSQFTTSMFLYQTFLLPAVTVIEYTLSSTLSSLGVKNDNKIILNDSSL